MWDRTQNRLHLVTLLAILVVLFAVLSFFRPAAYPTPDNLASMAFQMSEVGILALGIGLAFLVGALDLSVVAVANFAAIMAALVMTALEPSLGTGPAVAAGVAVALGVGVVGGLVNGTLVSRLRVHPIVLTLGTLTLFTGIATGITGGSTVFGLGALTPLGRGVVMGIPVPFLVFVALAGGLAFLTTRTPWGFRTYMVGSSSRVSRFARAPVERIQLAAYVASGLLASLAGLVILARTNAANVDFGSSYLLLAILVSVLAGVNPYGGSGRIFYTVFAVAAVQQLSTGLNMALAGWGGANFAREFAWGVLLIAVLGWSQRASGSGLGRLVTHWRHRVPQRVPLFGGDDAASGEDTDRTGAEAAEAPDVETASNRGGAAGSEGGSSSGSYHTESGHEEGPR